MIWILSAWGASPHLIVVSLDTTRADALSCYGAPPVPFRDRTPELPRTPVLDALAAEGVRFERFFATTPSTLSSHTTMFTGADPHRHGVVRNGFSLPPELPTLAERLRDAGWQTHAVLGAAALERGTGIERGFEAYDDASPTLRGIMYQSPADEVVDRALAAVAARDTARPLFLFVHLFDAHTPYEPPGPYGERFAGEGPYADPAALLQPLVGALRKGDARTSDLAAVNGRYLGEVAWMDAQIGRLLEGLGPLLADGAVLAVVGDHGEVLSEDPIYAWTHGNDVSEGVTRVPLILRGTGVPFARNAVVRRQASMEGLASTLERALGLEPTFGPDFWELVRPGPALDVQGWPSHPTWPVYQEATRPRQLESTTTWNNLPLRRAIQAGGFRVDAAPAEGEAPHGDVRTPGPVASVLAGMLAVWDAHVPAHRPTVTPEHTRRALEALGYVEVEP